MERFRDEITQMLIHDLRSPLGSVITSLRYIQDRMADNDYQDLDQVMEIAINSSENQMRMIESLLEIAKLETGRVPVSMSSGSLSKIASKAITALTALAHESEISMENRIPADFPSVCMDEELILRVLSNLLDNALRHTPVRGQVRIEAEPQVGRNFALISVIDTGKGILPDVREQIFGKFVQVPKSALRGHRGSGLGLTFCKLVIEAHGGQIWADSGPEGGAAFRFTLPFPSVSDSKS
jgi:signal transduction histidine kinase